MIDEVLRFAGSTSATRVVDVGCGIGGSSRHIAQKFGASAQGMLLQTPQPRPPTPPNILVKKTHFAGPW